MKQLILASRSPRRKMLLEQMGIPYTTLPADIDETIVDDIQPDELAAVLSERKAIKVVSVTDRYVYHCPIVLGADTIVVLDGHILGKPTDADDAFQMLKMLSGKWHEVMTGVTLVEPSTGRKLTHVEKTRVKIRKLTDEAINRYIDSGEPFDKAGSYGIQGLGALLVVKLEGCYYNVVGLPLYRVSIMFTEMGFQIL